MNVMLGVFIFIITFATAIVYFSKTKNLTFSTFRDSIFIALLFGAIAASRQEIRGY
ncbi:hypothetical protein [Methanosarcina sp. KYL-1]|uniref:hypothetical protein n=1 Tax=Methanosarcina sp. KYL-1 TaxID=2602068 RepID=UPI0021013B65|nr:hypothetical protein [Methanosarcina sp. KYL-1]